MKRAIAIIAIIFVSSIFVVKLLTSSTEFYINPTELTYKNDYSTNHDSILLNMVDTIELTVSGYTNNIEIAVDGIYKGRIKKSHKQDSSY